MIKIKNELWYFIWHNGKFKGAFSDKKDALQYANHMCWPGDWKIIPKRIKEN